MARAAVPGRLTWQTGTVAELIAETPRSCSVVLELDHWAGHRAGQHVDLRLIAPDGYEVQHSYFIASAPEDGIVVLTVQRVDDGVVSPHLVDELRVGDQLEVRGPIGTHFVWDESPGGPVMLIAGGSGIVPFRSMLRHRVATMSSVDVRLLYSARSLEEVIYRDELLRLAAYAEVDMRFVLTREWPGQWHGHRGRIDGSFLEQVAWPAVDRPMSFVCGPSGFVEAVSKALVAQGNTPAHIKTGRFGPSG